MAQKTLLLPILTLLTTVGLTFTAISYNDYARVRDKEEMRRGVERDKERMRRKREEKERR
jgi:hypothetical protein